jgi:hypothetical protein
MADLVITAATVVAGSAARRLPPGPAGEAVAAGKAVALHPTTKKWMLADSNSATAALRTADGIALNGAALDQPLVVAEAGPVTIGATLTPGVAYYLSDTPGGICPVGDVGSGEYVCLLGLATSSSVLDLDIQASGTAN